MISFHSTSILDTDAQALVNTVNCVGVMGKGLALAVKEKWPSVERQYYTQCRYGLVRPGFIHVAHPLEEGAPKFVLNFPTKRHWRDKSILDDIDSGLVALGHQVSKLSIASVAIPALGCVNGGLDWRDVLRRILKLAESMQIVDWRIHGPDIAKKYPVCPSSKLLFSQCLESCACKI